MWKQECKLEKKSPFEELLKLLGNPEFAHFMTDEEVFSTIRGEKFRLPDGTDTSEEDCPCIWCPLELPTEEEILEHMTTCTENPNAVCYTSLSYLDLDLIGALGVSIYVCPFGDMLSIELYITTTLFSNFHEL